LLQTEQTSITDTTFDCSCTAPAWRCHGVRITAGKRNAVGEAGG
jgi:hypothetical protein